jgi:PTH1 family peptidyl-tRNA hydrolase
MFLLVGLGNPEKTYANNRHNVGFMIIESIANYYDSLNFIKKFKSEYSKILINENICFLLKTMT